MDDAFRFKEGLLLADGRFPAGGHAHSYGAEAAVRELGMASIDDLRRFVLTRLDTVGRSEAALAAWVVANAPADWSDVDREADVRIAAPALRATSRQLGRQLARAAASTWPALALAEVRAVHPDGPHQPLAWGAVVGGLGGSPHDAATLTLHHLASGIASANLRLVGLDPFGVQVVLAECVGVIASIADNAASTAHDPIATLPAHSVALADLLAEAHATWHDRLFAS